MPVIARVVVIALLCLAAPSAARAASDALLFRLFLANGTSVVSYGEFARVGDRVVFSMLMGGSADSPRLHVATLPDSAVDWDRTSRHAASTRYQRYASTRGEDDFMRLTNDVAGVLNEVLLAADRTRVLALAERARDTLAGWPREHYGYRQQEVGELVAILDEAVSDLRAAAGITSFDVELVAMTPPVPIEPLAGMPSTAEQVHQAFMVAAFTDHASERVALLQSVLALFGETDGSIPPADIDLLRRSAEAQIDMERAIDARYQRLVARLTSSAARAAERADVAAIERAVDEVSREDARLGQRRPEVVQALRASIGAQLGAARRLRLLRDQWAIRRGLYREYQRIAGAQLLQLVKLQPALEAIRRLDGPAPEALVTLRARLGGGAERLERLRTPADLQGTHDLLVSAWRFAENAVNGRYEAARAASLSSAWEASSAAAGSLLLLSRVQEEIRQLLEPPQLQ